MFVLAYSGDAVYLYSTADDPGSDNSLPCSPSPLRTPNLKRKNESVAITIHEENGMDVDEQPAPNMMDQITLTADHDQDRDSEDAQDDSEGYIEFTNSSEVDEESFLPHVPVVLPRQRFAGARNVATIKDGGFDLF
jgi:hypothetical protein